MGDKANTKAIAFFKKVALRYSREDVTALIQNCRLAGPLLQVVANGIDLLGGMCYEFRRRNVGERSLKFMHKYMGIEETIAKMRYECVRCGVTHAGAPKVGIKYFVPPERTERCEIITQAPDGCLLLNAKELAYSYLAAIARIEKDPGEYIQYTPQFERKAREAFESALAQIPAAPEDILQQLGLMSYSAYTPSGEAGWFEVEPSEGAPDHSPSNGEPWR